MDLLRIKDHLDMLDKYLDGKFIPAFETARGCPYLCTFCDQGLDASKITAFSTKRLAEEMMYVGKKMSNNKEGTKTTFIFDANWGMFDKDIDEGLPLGREQTAEDIGNTVAFLASEYAKNITGQSLNVNGGTMMH